MRKVNYVSYNGHFHKVVEFSDLEFMKEWPNIEKKQNRGKMKFVERKKDKRVFFLERVSSSSVANPVIRIGIDTRRCPYCDNRPCLKEIVAKQDFFKVKRKSKWGAKRYICKCNAPQNKEEKKYFYVEFLENKWVDMLFTKRCLICNAKDTLEIKIFQTKPLPRESVVNALLGKFGTDKYDSPPPNIILSSNIVKLQYDCLVDFVVKNKVPLIYVEIKCKACNFSNTFVVKKDALMKPGHRKIKERIKEAVSLYIEID